LIPRVDHLERKRQTKFSEKHLIHSHKAKNYVYIMSTSSSRCSQTLDIHGQRVLQLILFLFMTL
jgi:hypothetical protein